MTKQLTAHFNSHITSISKDIIIRTNIESKLVDKEKALKNYPAEWICDISNNGRMLGLYDI